MTGLIYAAAVFTALLCVLAPGWALREIADACGMKFRRTGASRFLTPFALGVHFNALWFLVAWIAFPLPVKPHLMSVTLIGDLFVIVVGVVLSRTRQAQGHKQGTVRVPLHLAVVATLGLLVGSFACIQVPSVLDSIQILQIQNFILGWGWGANDQATVGVVARLVALLTGKIACPPMPGFSGLMLVPSLLLNTLPVVTVSAGMKVLLAVMAAFSAAHVGERLGLRPRLIVTLVLFAGLVFSRFGMYGVMTLGKDSIFAVPMFIAGVASLVGDRSGRQRHESNLYFSAAIFLGSVVVPYGLVFWAIYATLSFGRSRWLPDLRALLGWTALALPVSIAGIHTSLEGKQGHSTPLIVLIGVQVAAVLILTMWHRRTHGGVRNRPWLAPLASLVPLIAFVLCFLLMPAVAHIAAWTDAFGHVVMEEREPLDGQTSFFVYLFRSYHENLAPLMMVSVVGCMVLPFVKTRYRDAGFVALLSFLPVTLVLVLLHLKLGLSSLTGFNIWDITKNVPQWFVGALFPVIAILTLRALFGHVRLQIWSGLGWHRGSATIGALAVAIVMFFSARGEGFRTALHEIFLPAPMITSAGGYIQSDIAQAMAFVWSNARGGTVFVSSKSTFVDGFYAYQMYGARNTFEFSEKLLTDNFPKEYPQAAFLLDANDMRRVFDFARSMKASISAMTTADGLYMLLVTFDETGRLSGTDNLYSSIDLGAGTSAVEHRGKVSHR